MDSQWTPVRAAEMPGPVTGSGAPRGGGAVDAGPTEVAAGAGSGEGVAAGAGSGEEIVTGDLAGASAGEEEAHRSAVDSVDALLDEVDLALSRLDDGTYGRCEACGAPIDDGRLAADPVARSCGPCDTGAQEWPDRRPGDAAAGSSDPAVTVGS